MKILKEKVSRLYLGMVAASLGSALIASISSLVDMAMIGQYQGPSGPATLAVVVPIWNIICSLGLLMGIGGSVLFVALRGKSAVNTRQSNEVFTASLIGTLSLALISGGLILALPMVISPDALWYAMPITELVVSAAAIALIIHYTRQLRSRTA